MGPARCKGMAAGGALKPRNWKRLLELVPPMTAEVMQEVIKHSAAGDCSLGLDGIGKPSWHALAGVFTRQMTITMKWRLAIGYIPEALDHGIRTHVPKKNIPPLVNNMRLLSMLNERAKIHSIAISVSIEDMMQQTVAPTTSGIYEKATNDEPRG